MARRGRRPLSNSDIAMASGLSRSLVCKLSNLRTWDNVKLSIIQAFATGCGVNLMAPWERRDVRLVRAGKMEFMKRSSPAQRKMYQRILRDLGGGPRA